MTRDDWRRVAADVAHLLPGLGDPREMDVPQLYAWHDEAARIAKLRRL